MLHLLASFTTNTMALRVSNMVEAQLPATPAVATFVAGMLAVVQFDSTPQQVVRSDMFDGALHAVVETIPKASPLVAGCDRCGIVYHLHCVGLRFKPKYSSWACQGCLRAEGTVVHEDEP